MPITVVPSLKVTVPVGVPEPGETAATVAVNVTDDRRHWGWHLR